MAAALCSPSPEARAHAVTYAVPAVLAADPGALQALLQRLMASCPAAAHQARWETGTLGWMFSVKAQRTLPIWPRLCAP